MTNQLRSRLFLEARKLISIRPILTTPQSGMSTSTDMSSSQLKVIHDTNGKEFYIQLEKDGVKCPEKAVLQYSYLTNTYVDLEHTGVPTEYRGHGIAKILAKTAFDHFTDEKIDMRPSCTYLQKFYKENPLPQYKERVKWD